MWLIPSRYFEAVPVQCHIIHVDVAMHYISLIAIDQFKH